MPKHGKELKAYIDELVSEGWKAGYGRRQMKLRSPEGQLFTCSLTPSDINAHRQLQRDIRKYRK